MSWARLPVELQRAILEEVYEQGKDDGMTLIYQRVCKQWRNFMHERRLVSVQVGCERMPAFCTHIASTDDLLYMRRITLKILSNDPVIHYGSEAARKLGVAVYLHSLYIFLQTLAAVTRNNDKYASHPGIVLCLELYTLSDCWDTVNERILAAAGLRPGPMVMSFNLLPNNIIRVCQVDQEIYRCSGFSCFQDALSSCHGLQILRLSMQRSHALCSPRVSLDRPENSAETAFGYLLKLGMNSPVKSLIIYQTDFDNIAEHSKFGWQVAKAACNKEHVAISHAVDASAILGNAAAAENSGRDVRTLHWPVLRTLVLTASRLSGEHTPEQVQDFLVTVSESVSRMPMLETLELHHSDFNDVVIFRYTSHPPELYIAASRPIHDIQGILTPRVVKIWEKNTYRRLVVVEEQLPPNLSRVVIAYHRFAYPVALRWGAYSGHSQSSLCKELSTRGKWYTRTPIRHIIDEVADFKEAHREKKLIIR